LCFSPSGFVVNGPPQQAFCDFQIDQDGSFWEMTDTLEVQDADPNGKYSNPLLEDFCSGPEAEAPSTVGAAPESVPPSWFQKRTKSLLVLHVRHSEGR